MKCSPMRLELKEDASLRSVGVVGPPVLDALIGYRDDVSLAV